jgi:Rho-binding antiterminator
MTDYHPINCSYYDELEAIATLKKVVTIIYRDEQEEEVNASTRITNLFTRNKEEFMVLENGIQFRLDRLVSADGKVTIKGDACSL